MLYRITLKVTFPDTVYSLGPLDKRLVHLSSGVPKSSSDCWKQRRRGALVKQ